jgi:formyltetrahydrofolate-dependent phosphoribosylglycinamide formyltransferase
MFLRVAAVVSGRGSNLVALLHALGDGAPAQVVLVLSNRAGAGGVELARSHGIPVHLLKDIADPEEWCRVLEAARVDLVVLAGYLKRVPDAVVRAWRGRIINVHPALLPRHGGAGMYGRRVHEAVLAAGDSTSGATVHLVSEEYDQGDILAQGTVPVLSGDTPDTLAARVLAVEHKLLPATVLALARAGLPQRTEAQDMTFPTPHSPTPKP